MSRKHDIIDELEAEIGEKCGDESFDDILCDGDTCRHEECACWDTLSWAVREHLINKQYPMASEIVQRAAAVNITKDEIKDLICRRGLSLTDVIDVVCELNGFVGVGFFSFGDSIANYIKGKAEKRSIESWLND